MQAFLRNSHAGARDPASSVEQPIANSSLSSVEQPAQTFSSIAAVNRWLTVQTASINTPDIQKLRTAVSVLMQKPKPRKEQVIPLCLSWNVQQKDGKRFRSLLTLITELQHAVITEGNRMRASFDGQTEAPASRAEQPAPLAGNASSDGASASTGAQPAPLAGAASSAGEPAVAGCTSKRRLDSVCAAQPTLPTKRLRDSAVMKLLQGHPQASESS